MKQKDFGDLPRAAVDLFAQGYNCAQAVFGAFAPVIGMEKERALRLSSAFGGGFGRMREVCGAFSGVTLVLGELFGYSELQEENKDLLYPRVQELGRRFRERCGSLICRELLAFKAEEGGLASPRTAEYYKTRPCVRLVEAAAEILEEYLKAEGVL